MQHSCQHGQQSGRPDGFCATREQFCVHWHAAQQLAIRRYSLFFNCVPLHFSANSRQLAHYQLVFPIQWMQQRSVEPKLRASNGWCHFAIHPCGCLGCLWCEPGRHRHVVYAAQYGSACWSLVLWLVGCTAVNLQRRHLHRGPPP